MITSTIREIEADQIETQNEVKAPETENLNKDKENIIALNVDNAAKDDIRKNEHNTPTNEVVINVNKVLQVNTAFAYYDIQGRRHVPEYWAQFNIAGGNRIPDGGGPPLYYEPDRNSFVRIVFAIVLFMLMLTAGFVMFVYMTDVRKMFLRYGMFIIIIGMGGMLGLNYAMMCSACTRTPPCNFICLFLAVCFMSLIAGYVTARYRTQIILLALLATTVTVIVCLCLACSSFDFTRYLLYVIVIAAAFSALALIIGVTMMITNTRYKPVTLVILVVGTLLNVVILIMELQMILGGRTVELSEDDYALGAFMLYTSIIDIFLKLVHLLGILDEG